MYLASAHWTEELVAHLGSVLFLIGDVFKWLTAFRIADCDIVRWRTLEDVA